MGKGGLSPQGTSHWEEGRVGRGGGVHRDLCPGRKEEEGVGRGGGLHGGPHTWRKEKGGVERNGSLHGDPLS